ncbi:MAG TPA: hypothetical protein VN316_01265 [candidate division Zixibacteria bacterium]|nr:hypothetical protein [candidate division Zixibacteria bacterium]
MRFDNDILAYFAGERFSNGLCVPISIEENNVLDRMSLLEQLAHNKKVIHLGCVDHMPLIEEKIRTNMWLHERLHKSSKRCIGLDINRDGIDYLTKALGYSDVLCADIANDDLSIITNEQWDYLIMGEILEHLDAPVSFLKSIHEKYAANIANIIITVPNAFSWSNFRTAVMHKECINSDHRFWFTPYTLGMIVVRAGMKVDSFCFCESNSYFGGALRRRLRQSLMKRYPALRETLFMKVSL